MYKQHPARRNFYVFSAMKIQHPVVWITGASSGIGKAMAGVFYKHGYRIILSSRRKEELQKVAEEYNMEKTRFAILDFDLTGACSNAENLVQRALSFFGTVDVLVLNGGVSQRMSVLESSDAILRKMFEINFFSSVCLARCMLPHFMEKKHGQFIVISSIAGKFGFFLRPDYSASKHALHGYFDTLRLEAEPYGIRTLLVCPGKIRTSISENAWTKDGLHGKMDESHRNAMSAEEGAERIFRAMKKNKEEIWIGGKEILMVYLKNHLPFLFRKIIRKISPY